MIPSAATIYSIRVMECRELLGEIAGGIKRHEEIQPAPRLDDWGYVGDVTHLRDCLRIAADWINPPKPGKGK